MNNTQNIPDGPSYLPEANPKASKAMTVFSDGSTFDYENGYQNNGAPVATRDRTENPTIVKSHTVFNSDLVFRLVGWTLVIAAIAVALLFGVSNMQRSENINVIKKAITKSEQLEVAQFDNDVLFVKDSKGAMFKCDVSMISNNGDPVGLVFCADGGPAALSIPLRRDPSNILYMAPLEEIEEFQK
jgi:hypothetical protein